MLIDPPAPVSVAYPKVYYTAPLVSGLHQRGDLNLHALPPAELNGSVWERHGCMFVSPSALLNAPKVRLLPGIGVSTAGATGSERLISTKALEDIDEIQVHPDAAHLVPLLELLYLARGLTPPTRLPYTKGSTEALLCSGDRGRGMAEQPGHDLGLLWEAETGLPLVLGAWACAPGAPHRTLRTVLASAARTGLAQEHAEKGPLRYELLSRESDSLRAFHALAVSHGRAAANEEAIVFC